MVLKKMIILSADNKYSCSLCFFVGVLCPPMERPRRVGVTGGGGGEELQYVYMYNCILLHITLYVYLLAISHWNNNENQSCNRYCFSLNKEIKQKFKKMLGC